jgi:hypothetical protein
MKDALGQLSSLFFLDALGQLDQQNSIILTIDCCLWWQEFDQQWAFGIPENGKNDLSH